MGFAIYADACDISYEISEEDSSMTVKILMLGDVVGSIGCSYLGDGGRLRRFVSENKISLVIANGENSADGNGITPTSARELFDAGVDVITGGNHTLRKKNIYSMLDDDERVLRPDNMTRCPGNGHMTVDVYGYRILVISLAGQVYMDTHASSPFDKLDAVLADEAGRYDAAIVDIHAEATSEKIALARYADGRVSAVAGTHTHVQTADACVLAGGTGYITDLGMCGSGAGVLGVKTDCIIRKFRSPAPVTFEPADGELSATGAVFTIDLPSGRCISAESVKL